MKENKKSFTEKHPKLSILFGLFLILFITAGVIFFALWLIKLLKNGITNLADAMSKLDAVVFVAIITGFVSIVGVIISSIIAKIVDYKKSRQEYLTQKRETPYGEFVDMIYKLQQNTKNFKKYSKEEMLEDLSKFSKQITLWGSSEVINKWVQFRDKCSNTENANENLFLMEEIVNEMRKDLGLKKVKKGNILGFFINDIQSMMKK